MTVNPTKIGPSNNRNTNTTPVPSNTGTTPHSSLISVIVSLSQSSVASSTAPSNENDAVLVTIATTSNPIQ